MKLFTLSASLFVLVSIRGSWAAPASQKISTSSSKSLGNSTDYIVVMRDHEKRAWNEIFNEMGLKAREIEHPSHGFVGVSDKKEHHDYRTFEAGDGGHIRTFGTAMRMFTMKMDESEAENMAASKNVAIVHKDRKNTSVEWKPYNERLMSETNDTISDGGSTLGKRFGYTAEPLVQQPGAPWNLQRISQMSQIKGPAGIKVSSLGFTYRYDGINGKGVDVYVVDSGINTQHVEFGGRAKMIFSAYGPEHMIDDFGHGSHTSGTIGGAHYGIAKGVNLLGIKVLDDENRGTDATFVAGFEAALAAHLRRKDAPDFVGTVVSASIGGQGGSDLLFDVFKRMSNAGMHISISAMNDNADACGYFPGGYSAQLPIFNAGATDIYDQKADFSNYGPCVNIHAPGVAITSASNKGPE
ncbi:Aqualysin-1 [Dactylellina cionopaga]|nr:Aqualysin-1 [Dactylellina cionopaga]